MRSNLRRRISRLSYLERVSLFFDANGVPADKQVSTLLTVIGPGNYGIIRSLVAPALPKEKSYDQLVAVLVNHFQPKPLVIAERYRFYQRCQAPGETVQDFVADLRRLAITCDFGEFLDQALRDRFVCGLKSEQIQKVLLAEDSLTIDRALELAQAKEAAARDAKNFKAPLPLPLLLCTSCLHLTVAPPEAPVGSPVTGVLGVAMPPRIVSLDKPAATSVVE